MEPGLMGSREAVCDDALDRFVTFKSEPMSASM